MARPARFATDAIVPYLFSVRSRKMMGIRRNTILAHPAPDEARAGWGLAAGRRA